MSGGPSPSSGTPQGECPITLSLVEVNYVLDEPEGGKTKPGHHLIHEDEKPFIVTSWAPYESNYDYIFLQPTWYACPRDTKPAGYDLVSETAHILVEKADADTYGFDWRKALGLKAGVRWEITITYYNKSTTGHRYICVESQYFNRGSTEPVERGTRGGWFETVSYEGKYTPGMTFSAPRSVTGGTNPNTSMNTSSQ